MTMTLAVFEQLLADYAGVLTVAAGCTVTPSQGYPVWGRPGLTNPCVALESYGWQPGANRTGQRQALAAKGYRGWLFARSEPELCALEDALVTYHREHNALVVATRRVDCSLLEIKRYEPELTMLEEAHADAFLVQVTW